MDPIEPRQEENTGEARSEGLAGLAVRFPVTVSMFFIGVILLGYVSLTNLPTNLFPDLRAPRVTVTADAPGLSPQEIERIVTEQYEGSLSTIKGVEQVTSVARADSGVIQVDFEWGTDMDFALLDVKKQVGGYNIQELSEPPQVLRYDPNDIPVLTLALHGEKYSPEYLYLLAYRTIGPALERLPGVARAVLTGGEIPEIRCRLDPDLVVFYGFTPSEIESSLQQANVSATGGWVEQGNVRYLIRAIGELEAIDQVREVVVGYRNNVPIYLADLGEISWEPQEPENAVWYQGKTAVGLSLYREAGSNTVEVVKIVREFLAQIEGGGAAKMGGGGGSRPGRGRGRHGRSSGGSGAMRLLPKDIQLDVAYDQSVFITRSIDEVKSSALQGAGLAIIILLIFLRSIRSTFIVGISIPVSIIATFNLMYFMDLSLNVMTLGGLALGAGMLVDNAIVVLENIFRQRQMGAGAKDAAIHGSGEVGSAIIASTLTTVVVFLPIAWIGGLTAQLFKEQALTVVFSLLTSLVVALLMIPALAARLLRGRFKPKERKHRLYTAFLRGSLRMRWVVLIVTVLVVWASIPPARTIPQEFIPQAAEKQFVVELRLPTGTELDVTGMAAKTVEGWLSEFGDDVASVYTLIGKSPETAASMDADPEGPHTGKLLITMADTAKRSVPSVVEELKRRLQTLRGAEAHFLLSQSSIGSLIGEAPAAIIVEIRGRRLTELANLAGQAQEMLQRTSQVTNIRSNILEGNPEVTLIPDRTIMASLGISPQRLIGDIRSHLRGNVATTIQDVDQSKDIRVQLGKDDVSLNALEDMVIQVQPGKAVRVGEIAKIVVQEGPREIVHRDQERVAHVYADLSEGVKLSEAVAEVRSAMELLNIDENYRYEIGGEEKRREESFKQLSFALLLALTLVYMVMASLFESLIHPFVIMFSIPLAAVGVVWAFVISGQTMNMMGYIGVIMLAGIVVNNAIVLVDYINRLRREEGVERREAIVLAGQRRLRPILMTTLTTVLALLPLAMGIGEGAEIRAPMAIAVIGGLVSSTLLTLVFIPVLYSIVDDLIELILRPFRRWSERRERREKEAEVSAA